jgi:hypothetical protein
MRPMMLIIKALADDAEVQTHERRLNRIERRVALAKSVDCSKRAARTSERDTTHGSLSRYFLTSVALKQFPARISSVAQRAT